MPDVVPDVDWTDDQLVDTLAAYAGAGDDSEQPEPVRFVRGVQRLLRKRLPRRDAQTYTGPALFLLSPTPPSAADEYPQRRVPMLDKGLEVVDGNVWFVGPVVASAVAIPIDDTAEDADLIALVVEKLALGSVPAVYYDPRDDEGEIRYYPSGMKHLDDREVVSITAVEVSLDDIFKVIDRVHAAKLRIPESQSPAGKLWAPRKAKSYWAASNAESVVQMYVETALWVAFGHCKVYSEFTTSSGRLDVSVVGRVAGTVGVFVHYAVLELKVLRGRNASGHPVSANEIDDWIASGVDQAYSYRESHEAMAAALCCFDLRQEVAGQSCFDHVKRKASRKKVTLKCWHCFGKSSDLRKLQDPVATA